MSFPIETGFTTGANLYAVIRNPSGQYWRADTHVFEAFNASNWGSYAVALVEDGSSGIYGATYPSQISGVLTTEYIYQRQGGSPAISDAPNIASSRSQGQNLAQVGGDATLTANFLAALGVEQIGACQTGTLTSTQATTNLAAATANTYNGRTIVFTSGALKGQAALISGYTPSGGIVFFSALTGAPANTDTFIII